MLLSRSAYLIFSALGLLLTVGFLADSPLSPSQKLKAGFPFIQAAIIAYQLRRVWSIRTLDFWSDIRVKLSLMVFTAASVGPFVVLLYFIFFPPRFAPERGASFGLAATSLLLGVYGVLLLVSPQVALKFDYVYPMYSKSSRGKTPFGRGIWRVVGAFLLLVGILLAYFAGLLMRGIAK